MKNLLSLTFLSAFLFASAGCAERVAYSHRVHDRPGYYDDRRSAARYEDRRSYRRDRYDDRREVRVYGAPRVRPTAVSVQF